LTFIDGPITANNPMGVHHAWGIRHLLSAITIMFHPATFGRAPNPMGQ
jgi:hypothetical protein